MNDAGTFANWQDGFKAGKPAVSIRPVGKGQVIYAGTYLTEQVCEKLLPELVSLARLERPFPNLSPDIDVVRRYKDGAELIFLINHYSTEVDGGVLPDGEILVGNNNAIFSAFDVKILKR